MLDEKDLEIAEMLSTFRVEQGIQEAVNSLPVQPPDFDGLCDECGEPIPAPRLRFGAVTCVDCQEHLELQTKMRRINPDL